ncbi:acyl-CoA dehydrogenase family protein [uncultured Sneathiella sp.]|uniref:acyl-CoA dehydrogenase family protein n=1 Tax=uncultured Sneathiella sp. TaxID=879315 RepID=UPI002599D27B|nr:acyl-CoA dehydrogenase family protein [uncultured Sneathiella sp.]
MYQKIIESEDRRQLRDSVALFARKEAPLNSIRENAQTPEGYSHNRWKSMTELGWAGMLIPEEAAGLGLGLGDVAALHEEIGRASIREPLAVTALLAARAIALGHNDRLKTETLPEIICGNMTASLAWMGGNSGLDINDVGPVAVPTENGWQISGTAQYVPLANNVDAYIVAARSSTGTLLFFLDDLSHVSIDSAGLSDGTSQGNMTFDELMVPLESVIAAPEHGSSLLDDLLDIARVAVSAELLGNMQQALNMSLAYLRQREQFGRTIGSFQVLQHKAVDLYIQIELARTALWRAVETIEAGADANARAMTVSAAKWRCSEAGLLVVQQGIQFHGAIGYTDEYDLSLYVHRTIVLATFLGNARAHRARYAKLFLSRESKS